MDKKRFWDSKIENRNVVSCCSSKGLVKIIGIASRRDMIYLIGIIIGFAIADWQFQRDKEKWIKWVCEQEPIEYSWREYSDKLLDACKRPHFFSKYLCK